METSFQCTLSSLTIYNHQIKQLWESKSEPLERMLTLLFILTIIDSIEDK